jgi:hypothetical protein
MSEQDKQNLSTPEGVDGAKETTPPTDPSYWYWERQSEKQRKSEPKAETPEVTPATPPVEQDQFVTRDEFIQAQKERRVLEYVRQNPEFQPFAEKVLQYWNHPSRRELPVESAFADAVGIKELMRLGAEKATREAQEADQTNVGGGVAVRGGDSSGTASKSIFAMTPEEFAQYKAEKLKL